jgi:methylglutamate dehydrogenase subunit C
MRIDGYGQIDRAKPISFTFDGRRYSGFKGDTLASALLANGVRLVGRSFKYHRPRGIMTAGFEEPNALVEIIGAKNQTPNVRATGQEIFDGLTARSQNRWPSLRFDLLAVNDLAAPFLGAGFYYKTFMWPRAFWEGLYEPMIRRAAGLGRLSGKHDEGQYEKAYAFCDVLVIGAGPAGLAAALTAARSGADVILCEEKAQIGGRALGEAQEIGGKAAREWLADVQAEMAALPNLRVMRRTSVTGAYDGGVYSALERDCTAPPAPICRANVSGASRRRKPCWRRARWNAPSPLPIMTAPASCWPARCRII